MAKEPEIEPGGLEWRLSSAPVPYPAAVAEMERRVAGIRAGTAPEMVWLLEHPSLYTAGTSARPEELLEPDRLPVFATGRGGRYTYHGPGQRVAYVMFDLKRRGMDVRAFVRALEDWVIATLARFAVHGERRRGRVGIWVAREGPGASPGAEDKIAAVGVRVRRWVTYHGISINVDPDLTAYRGIIPCGVPPGGEEGGEEGGERGRSQGGGQRGGQGGGQGGGPRLGVTSLAELGIPVSMAELDGALKATFAAAFAGLAPRPGPEPGAPAKAPADP